MNKMQGSMNDTNGFSFNISPRYGYKMCRISRQNKYVFELAPLRENRALENSVRKISKKFPDS